MTTPDRSEDTGLVLMRPLPGETREQFKARFRQAMITAGLPETPPAPQE